MKEELHIKLDDDSGKRTIYNAAREREEYNKDVKTRAYERKASDGEGSSAIWGDNVKLKVEISSVKQ